MLGQWTDTSRRTLVRQFAPLFVRPLTPMEVWTVLPPRCSRAGMRWIYGADGKWLHHDGPILLHRDITHKENIWWSYALNESYASWNRDLESIESLLKDGSFPSDVVSDWKRGLIQAVVTAFGDVPHQRCLAHVARQE